MRKALVSVSYRLVPQDEVKRMKNDLHELPKFKDSLSYLYTDHVIIEQDKKSIMLIDKESRTHVPCANLSLLMLGPGTSITHESIKNLCDNGCLIAWTGEEGVRFYASGMGETRSAKNILHQAKLVSNPKRRLEVVRRLYAKRLIFDETDNMSIEQLRGVEGIRVRDSYAKASEEYGVPWKRRKYDRVSWYRADPINRALSCANSCLYGICHAGIVSIGYSPALGFIHTGKQLSFVYDIADLYKTEITIPLAFETTAESEKDLERRVRTKLRDRFKEAKLLKRIVQDIDEVMDITDRSQQNFPADSDPALPSPLWNGK